MIYQERFLGMREFYNYTKKNFFVPFFHFVVQCFFAGDGGGGDVALCVCCCFCFKTEGWGLNG